ncbi:hypothetical protein EIP86_010034 [Pleurotus ostreatoroseus]|nr:hypothetical protein EIP86_010034 [Pleurotus ostreatoroseus]
MPCREASTAHSARHLTKSSPCQTLPRSRFGRPVSPFARRWWVLDVDISEKVPPLSTCLCPQPSSDALRPADLARAHKAVPSGVCQYGLELLMALHPGWPADEASSPPRPRRQRPPQRARPVDTQARRARGGLGPASRVEDLSGPRARLPELITHRYPFVYTATAHKLAFPAQSEHATSIYKRIAIRGSPVRPFLHPPAAEGPRSGLRRLAALEARPLCHR